MLANSNEVSDEPRAGALGVITCIIFGALTVLTAFVAAWFWSDGDRALSAAISVSSISVPIIAGFLFTEWKHQRAGAIAFVIAAGLFSGAVGAYASQERDDYEARRDFGKLVVPIEDSSGADADRTSYV